MPSVDVRGQMLEVGVAVSAFRQLIVTGFFDWLVWRTIRSSEEAAMGQWWLRYSLPRDGARRFLLFQSGLEVATLVFPKKPQPAYFLRIDPSEISLLSAIRAAVLAPGLERTDRAIVLGMKRWLFEYERFPDLVWYVTAKSAEAVQQARDRRFTTMPSQEIVEDFLDSLDRRRGSNPSPPELRLVMLEIILGAPGAKPGAFQKLKCDVMLVTLTASQLGRYASIKRDFLRSRGDLPRGWKTKEGAFRAAQRLQQAARVRLRKYNQAPE